jgi:hypothetical protein
MKTRIALNTAAKSIRLTDDRFAELTRAAQAQGKTTDEPAPIALFNRRLDDLWRSGRPRPTPANPASDLLIHAGTTWKPSSTVGDSLRLPSLAGLDTLQRIQDPQRAAGSRVLVASLVDLAGMKMRVIQVRGNWKDYADIHALASHGIDLPTALAAAKVIDKSFDPATSIRAIQFYGDGHWIESRWLCGGI